MEPYQYAYLVGSSVCLLVWLIFFLARKDLRKEMLVMSVLLGGVSVITAHYWWTVDWWLPTTITGTRIGIEDLIIGFGSGGIMAVAYEEIFKKRLYHFRSKQLHRPGASTILLLLAFLTSWLFWGVELTSFWASTLGLAITASVLLYFRRDLFLCGVLSGILMAVISLVFYFTVILISPEWISMTYQLQNLSGLFFLGIPVEEFVFWFLGGLTFGPFYEYWQGERLRNIGKK